MGSTTHPLSRRSSRLGALATSKPSLTSLAFTVPAYSGGANTKRTAGKENEVGVKLMYSEHSQVHIKIG